MSIRIKNFLKRKSGGDVLSGRTDGAGAGAGVGGRSYSESDATTSKTASACKSPCIRVHVHVRVCVSLCVYYMSKYSVGENCCKGVLLDHESE